VKISALIPRLVWLFLAVAVGAFFWGTTRKPATLIPFEANVTDLGNGWVRIEFRGEKMTDLGNGWVRLEFRGQTYTYYSGK
jgi:hypothetical protein